MGELKIKLSDSTEKKFREYAFKRYGYKRGALSKLAEEIVLETVSKKTKANKDDLFLKSFGSWKDIDTESLIREIYKNRSISTRKIVELE